MINVNDENQQNIVLDVGNDSIVTDPVAPESRLVLGQTFSHAPWVL